MKRQENLFWTNVKNSCKITSNNTKVELDMYYLVIDIYVSISNDNRKIQPIFSEQNNNSYKVGGKQQSLNCMKGWQILYTKFQVKVYKKNKDNDFN